MRWNRTIQNLTLIGIGALLLGLGSAKAADGHITDRANLLAGPAMDFPDVRILPPGAAITVHGCLLNRKWCDVTWRGNRGWVASEYIAYSYPDGQADVHGIFLQLGVPVITFTLNDYWDENYRMQSFYSDRAEWSRRFVNNDNTRKDGDGHQQQAGNTLQKE